jgi:hypothetical protein
VIFETILRFLDDNGRIGRLPPKPPLRALVTRDPDGYPNVPLPVIDPVAALSWLPQE